MLCTPKKSSTTASRQSMTTPCRRYQHHPTLAHTTAKTPHYRPTTTAKKKKHRKTLFGEEPVTVAIRLRPMMAKETATTSVWHVDSTEQSVVHSVDKPSVFAFDKAFDGHATTAQIYNAVAKPIVASTLSGMNGAILAYGQTSSGKTFTMQGSGGPITTTKEQSQQGIVQLAVADIFQHIHDSPNRSFIIQGSFLEVYKEEIRDLLSPDSAKTLTIQVDPRGNVHMPAETVTVVDADSLLELLWKGEKARKYAATAMNDRSSRGHSIFRIQLTSRAKAVADNSGGDDDARWKEQVQQVSTLDLVDLAGSESVKHTGATDDRQKEGGLINKSLLSLSKVIEALGNQNDSFVSYRESKLTRILQPSLSGNARLAIVCCATPSHLYQEETRSTLQFASRAKLIQTRAQVNQVIGDCNTFSCLQEELDKVQERPVELFDSQDLVLALEEKVASSAAEVVLHKQAFSRLVSSLFRGDIPVVKSSATCRHQRRNSAGDVPLHVHPNSKATKFGIPQTLPRMKKNTKFDELHPSQEIALLRDALRTTKGQIAELVACTDDFSKLCGEKDARIIKLELQLDNLHDEREAVAACLQAKLDTLTRASGQKDVEIAELGAINHRLRTEKQEYEARFQSKIDELSRNNSESTELAALAEANTLLCAEKQSNTEIVARLEADSRRLQVAYDNLVQEKEKVETDKKSLIEQQHTEIEMLKSVNETLRTEAGKYNAQLTQLSEFNSRLLQEQAKLDDANALLKAESVASRSLEKDFSRDMDMPLSLDDFNWDDWASDDMEQLFECNKTGGSVVGVPERTTHCEQNKENSLVPIKCTTVGANSPLAPRKPAALSTSSIQRSNIPALTNSSTGPSCTAKVNLSIDKIHCRNTEVALHRQGVPASRDSTQQCLPLSTVMESSNASPDLVTAGAAPDTDAQVKGEESAFVIVKNDSTEGVRSKGRTIKTAKKTKKILSSLVHIIHGKTLCPAHIVIKVDENGKMVINDPNGLVLVRYTSNDEEEHVHPSEITEYDENQYGRWEDSDGLSTRRVSRRVSRAPERFKLEDVKPKKGRKQQAKKNPLQDRSNGDFYELAATMTRPKKKTALKKYSQPKMSQSTQSADFMIREQHFSTEGMLGLKRNVKPHDVPIVSSSPSKSAALQTGAAYQWLG